MTRVRELIFLSVCTVSIRHVLQVVTTKPKHPGRFQSEYWCFVPCSSLQFPSSVKVNIDTFFLLSLFKSWYQCKYYNILFSTASKNCIIINNQWLIVFLLVIYFYIIKNNSLYIYYLSWFYIYDEWCFE